MSTLFVGIDVSSKTNAVYAMDFEENKYISSTFGNNQPGSEELADMIVACMQKHKGPRTLVKLKSVVIYAEFGYAIGCRVEIKQPAPVRDKDGHRRIAPYALGFFFTVTMIRQYGRFRLLEHTCGT